MAGRKPSSRPRGRSREIRIIGGDWRGRRLKVADAPGLRPTPDRVRETLFNWLAVELPGARVLDAFAGAGALGFEAASRGAHRVLLVERDRRVAAALRRQAEAFDDERLEVVHGDVLAFLERSPPLDLDGVFIDPPYARPELRGRLLRRLLAGGHLRDDALLYLEWPAREAALPGDDFPESELTWIKRKQAGEVAFALARRAASG